MKPSTLSKYLGKAVSRRYPTLVKGKPGIGKTDIMKAAAARAGADLIVSHPVVSDPSDFKGLPFPTKDGRADFLPFGDLDKLAKAKKDTVFFLDDLGQAPASVQAACMQLILARQINGHLVSDKVTFFAATNRREDKAGVNGLLEPVKSRFYTILELEVDVEDWAKWAVRNQMPPELISFLRFKPVLLNDFQPSKDIVNSPCPRTIANLGRQQFDGLDTDEMEEVFSGAVGQAFASEYMSFLTLCRGLPNLDDIIADPDHAQVHENPSIMYAITGGLAYKMTDNNMGAICTYLDRIEPEFAVACISDATGRDEQLCNNRAYIMWAKNHQKDII